MRKLSFLKIGKRKGSVPSSPSSPRYSPSSSPRKDSKSPEKQNGRRQESTESTASQHFLNSIERTFPGFVHDEKLYASTTYEDYNPNYVTDVLTETQLHETYYSLSAPTSPTLSNYTLPQPLEISSENIDENGNAKDDSKTTILDDTIHISTASTAMQTEDYTNVLDESTHALIEQMREELKQQKVQIEQQQNELYDLKIFRRNILALATLPQELYKRGVELMYDGWLDEEPNHSALQQGLKYLRAGADLGDINAQFEYGETLLRHCKGKKDEEGMKYVRLAYSNGNAKAGIFLNKMRQYKKF
jgi:hypothetical protein